jgi:hypothetical protein
MDDAVLGVHGDNVPLQHVALRGAMSNSASQLPMSDQRKLPAQFAL